MMNITKEQAEILAYLAEASKDASDSVDKMARGQEAMDKASKINDIYSDAAFEQALLGQNVIATLTRDYAEEIRDHAKEA